MNGVIILAGGGDEKQSAIIDERFRYYVGKKTKSTNVLYIPLALKKERYTKAAEWFNATYPFLENVRVVKDRSDIDNISALNFDAIYIGGGNTGDLASRLKVWGLDKYIKDQYERGAIIYGGSAGAIVLGKSIATAPADELNGVQDFNGLGILGDYSILPHFTGEFSQKDFTAPGQNGLKIIGIAEDAGVIIRDGEIIETINPKSVSIYSSLS